MDGIWKKRISLLIATLCMVAFVSIGFAIAIDNPKQYIVDCPSKYINDTDNYDYLCVSYGGLKVIRKNLETKNCEVGDAFFSSPQDLEYLMLSNTSDGCKSYGKNFGCQNCQSDTDQTDQTKQTDQTDP